MGHAVLVAAAHQSRCRTSTNGRGSCVAANTLWVLEPSDKCPAAAALYAAERKHPLATIDDTACILSIATNRSNKYCGASATISAIAPHELTVWTLTAVLAASTGDLRAESSNTGRFKWCCSCNAGTISLGHSALHRAWGPFFVPTFNSASPKGGRLGLAGISNPNPSDAVLPRTRALARILDTFYTITQNNAGPSKR
jgi:hypothetical protein